jgi:glyoxylate reductase
MTPDSKPLVAVTRPNLPGAGLERLRGAADLAVWESPLAPDPDDLAELARDAEILLCLHGDPVSASLLDRLPRLRLIAIASVGYDTVDVGAAAARGIAVTNTPGVLDEATADLAFALILAARRRLVEGALYVRSGSWTKNDLGLLVGYDVHSTSLGLVGYGAIARAVARRAAGFGMRLRHYARTRADDALSVWTPLDHLLRESDIVSIHTPLSPETRGMIGRRELDLMKPTATLVNTARGPVVDEAALIDTLRERRIFSAGLDVQVLEPNPNPDHPLHTLDNCVVVPHIGSATVSARAAMIDLAVDNALAHLAGRPLLTEVSV